MGRCEGRLGWGAPTELTCPPSPHALRCAPLAPSSSHVPSATGRFAGDDPSSLVAPPARIAGKRGWRTRLGLGDPSWLSMSVELPLHGAFTWPLVASFKKESRFKPWPGSFHMLRVQPKKKVKANQNYARGTTSVPREVPDQFSSAPVTQGQWFLLPGGIDRCWAGNPYSKPRVLSECQSPIAGALVKLLIWADVVNRRALAPCQKQMVCLPGIFLWVLRLPF